MRQIAFTMLTLALAACPSPRAGGPAGADSAPLEGTAWRLADIGGQPSPVAPDSARHPGFTLLAEGRKVQGSAGCNRMSGTYELEGAKLKFGPLITTRMACPAMETETAFLKALEATTRYQVSGKSLTLFGGDTAVARLEAAP